MNLVNSSRSTPMMPPQQRLRDSPMHSLSQTSQSSRLPSENEYNRLASYKRTKDMITGKWTTLTRDCNKFVEVVENINAWDVLKDHHKWRGVKAVVPGRRVCTNEDIEDPNELFREDTISRSLGNPMPTKSQNPTRPNQQDHLRMFEGMTREDAAYIEKLKDAILGKYYPQSVQHLSSQRSVHIIPELLRSRNELEEIFAMVEEKRLKLMKFLIIGWVTQREAQLATELNILTRQLVESIDKRPLFIQELECLPGNLLVYKTREELKGLQKDDLIKAMEMRKVALQLLLQVLKELEFYKYL
ncbi:hypothetical protein Tco_0631368 [Tanacetum coccineum]